jgi:uncharacterized small protein (DUF1192 family)
VNNRERLLAILVGSLIVGTLIFLGVNKLVFQKASELDTQIGNLTQDIDRVKAENAKEGKYRARMKDLATAAFGIDELRASEEVRSHLAEMLKQSGLGMETLSLQPVVGRRLAGVYKEIGWVVRSHGKLEQVVNFVFLLQTDPYLHRLENLILTPIARTADVDIQVKYSTLVLEVPDMKKMFAERSADALAFLEVDAPQRRPYDVITRRDLFRPYVQRRASSGETTARTPRSSSENSPEGRIRVVGLPSWGNQQEVLVKDASTGETHGYKPGDSFGGGSIVMIDYRTMPLPDKPEIFSESRVIIQVGAEFWAIELGHSLAQKRRLSLEELPPQLRPLVPETPVGPPAAQTTTAVTESTSTSAPSSPKPKSSHSPWHAKGPQAGTEE